MRLLLASALVAALPVLAHGHFILVEPASWLVENRLGDPLCSDLQITADPAKPIDSRWSAGR